MFERYRYNHARRKFYELRAENEKSKFIGLAQEAEAFWYGSKALELGSPNSEGRAELLRDVVNYLRRLQSITPMLEILVSETNRSDVVKIPSKGKR
ncbi:MAG: hypothetical protein Q7R96_05100 [Nanoarchaeota archaeon]|nr:hypothetical protein [Nanoarchaeota archaeon]